MQANSLILLNVVGTNGQTRHQKVITERFNGQGQAIDTEGVPTSAPGLALSIKASKAPDFPYDKYAAAQAAGDKAEIQRIMLAHGEQIAKWNESQDGGTEQQQLIKAVIDYLKKVHDFHTEDGDWFVIKPENIDVTTNELKDGRTMYQIAGSAVFGNGK